MLHVPPQFTVTRIASVPGARELAVSPNGDLYAGTRGGDVYVVRKADAAHPESATVYVHFDDTPAAGVSYANGTLYVGTQHAVWRIENGKPVKIAAVRTGNPPQGSDGDVHTTTSVAADGSTVYASVGSSCNACVETDSTRATVGKIEQGRYVPIARRIRNAIALAINPRSRDLWASDAGQDDLQVPHPYEFIDDVSARKRPVDYGWPFCYEDHRRAPGSHEDCRSVAIPRVVFPAYETPVGAAFYPEHPHGAHAFPAQYRGGIFVTLHGSWHGPAQGLPGFQPPRVVFVPVHGDRPARAVNWKNSSAQWNEFITGYQDGGSDARSGRPTGIAVAPSGDLFVADDQAGAIYRIRFKASANR